MNFRGQAVDTNGALVKSPSSPMWRAPRIEMIVAYACDSHLQMALTDLPSYVCVSKGLVHCMQPLLGCFILSPVYVVLFRKEEPGVSALHHSISEPNGSGSIFITGADNHHAVRQYDCEPPKQFIHRETTCKSWPSGPRRNCCWSFVWLQLHSGMDGVIWTLF